VEAQPLNDPNRQFGLYRWQRNEHNLCSPPCSESYENWKGSRLDKMAGKAHHNGDYQRSYEMFCELTHRNPGNARYWNEMGDQLDELKRFGEGLACLKKAQALGRGEHWFFWGNIGEAYYFLGMKKEGIDAYEKYLAMMLARKGADFMNKKADLVYRIRSRLTEMREHPGF